MTEKNIPMLESGKDFFVDLGEIEEGVTGEKRAKMRRGLWRAYLVTSSVIFLAVIAVIGIYFIGRAPHHSFADNVAQLILNVKFANVKSDEPIIETDTPDENSPESEGIPDIPSGATDSETEPPTEDEPHDFYDSLYTFDHSLVPEGHKAIIPMDLSLSSYGVTYINNFTGYSPDTEGLLRASLGGSEFLPLSVNTAPLVLIIHTHGREGFCDEGAISYVDNGGDIARSEDGEGSVSLLGALMAERLNEKGISTIHAEDIHDISYKDSYKRSAETVAKYLQKYPSIKLVIDVHRDSIMTSSGDLVRPVTLVNGMETAQVMCVVGSDWGGDECKNWQNNLSLALKIREKLNAKYNNLCRPTSLRSTTYNQEMSSYSLLVEIGACGNSYTEAARATELVADSLAEIIKNIPK